MGVHVEWLDVKYTSVRLIEAGQTWDGEALGDDHGGDDDTVNAGNIAVTLGTDSVTVIEGTPADVRKILTAALDLLDLHDAPPDFPMPDEAVEGDEVTCPAADEETGEVCGAVMEVRERVWDYRPTHWNEGRDGTVGISIGDGQYGDGEFEEFICENGHVFRPDWDRTDYR